MGQAVLLLVGIYVIVGIMYSILTMFLSEAVKNGIAAMGIMIGGMFLTLFAVMDFECRTIVGRQTRDYIRFAPDQLSNGDYPLCCCQCVTGMARQSDMAEVKELKE